MLLPVFVFSLYLGRPHCGTGLIISGFVWIESDRPQDSFGLYFFIEDVSTYVRVRYGYFGGEFFKTARNTGHPSQIHSL